jgi:hypothetical protein
MSVIAVPATASTFDGAWLVEVVAGKGPCQGVYAFPVSVTGGKITYAGSMAMQASGGIDGRGRVRAALNNGRDRLSATGALRDSSGTGT